MEKISFEKLVDLFTAWQGKNPLIHITSGIIQHFPADNFNFYTTCDSLYINYGEQGCSDLRIYQDEIIHIEYNSEENVILIILEEIAIELEMWD